MAEPVITAARPKPKNGKAAMASRVIHERRAWKYTWMKRQGRPISSQTQNSPSPTSARAISAGSAMATPARAAVAEATKSPLPAPPKMKFAAARQSQLC
jgi:hypothetical protein